MDTNSTGLTFALNETDICANRLAEALRHIDQSHQEANEVLQEFLTGLGDVRLKADRSALEAKKIWEEFLRAADVCFSVADECPQQIVEAFASSFKRLGLTPYGLPGSAIDALANYDIVGKKDTGNVPLDGVVQTVAVGLRDKEGAIVRRARVIVAG